MTQRITEKHLRAKVDRVNRALGFDVNSDHGAMGYVEGKPAGSVMLYGAYGGHDVHLLTRGGGASALLGGCGPAREAAFYLDGLLRGIELARKV